MATLQTSRVMAAELDDVPAVIRIRNLQYTIQGPADAWGRRGKPQPMYISADASLAAPFGSSSAKDAVAPDTVHYGLLSKAILKSLAVFDHDTPTAHLHSVLERLWIDVTGYNALGGVVARDATLSSQLSAIRGLRMSLQLPKASRLGGAVSLTASMSFHSQGHEDPSPSHRSMALAIHGLRLPVLIGVNENERLGKQVVVASVEVDRLAGVTDAYYKLEEVIEQVSVPSISSSIHLSPDIMNKYHDSDRRSRPWTLRPLKHSRR
jgi:dihydroneopterin aldolase